MDNITVDAASHFIVIPQLKLARALSESSKYLSGRLEG